MSHDVVVVGGGPAGIIAAVTARSVYPDKSVCLIKSIGDGVIPCAIPYMMRTLADPAANAMGNAPLEKAGVEVIVDTVVSLDTEARTITLEEGGEKSYERLVLATGTSAVMPKIPGIELTGVHGIHKSMSAMVALREELAAARRIVVIGGGFIGAEFADELVRSEDKEVHLVEVMPNVLMTAFDDDLCDQAAAELSRGGVSLHLGDRVDAIEGDGHVEAVALSSGERLEADAVVVGIGARPASEIAGKAGLRTVDGGGVWVDDYMRTQAEEVFAVGDCALKRDFFTRREVPVWLASTATAEARIAGTNLYGVCVLRQIQGTVAAFSTKIGETAFASAGLTARTAAKQGFQAISATAEAPDRHPGALPGAKPLRLTLVFADRSGILLGGQCSGGPSVGELINVIALGIQKRVTVRELDMMQIATHPMLTSAPTVHPLIGAAHAGLAILRSGRK